MFNRRISPAAHAITELNLPALIRLLIKTPINIEQNDLSVETTSVAQQEKSIASFVAFIEKLCVAVSTLFYSAGNAQQAFGQKNNFSNNTIHMQLINSVFPFLISNLGACIFMLNNLWNRRELLQQYKNAKERPSQAVVFNRYQLMMKIGFRAAFSDHPEIIEKWEQAFIEMITQLYFPGKTVTLLNDAINNQLSCLQKNSFLVESAWPKYVLSALALTAMAVATFGTYFIEPEYAYAISGLIAATLVALVMLGTHLLEHSNRWTTSIKKKIKDALVEVNNIEIKAEKIIEGVLTQLSEKERQYLEESAKQLTQNEIITLLEATPNLTYKMPPLPNSTSPAVSWSFFKNMGRQAGDAALAKAEHAYQESLSILEKTFGELQTALNKQKVSILDLTPEHQNNMDFLLNPNINFAAQINDIDQKLQLLMQAVYKIPQSIHHNFRVIKKEAKNFNTQYMHVQNNQKVYNEGLESVAYLQQLR